MLLCKVETRHLEALKAFAYKRYEQNCAVTVEKDKLVLFVDDCDDDFDCVRITIPTIGKSKCTKSPICFRGRLNWIFNNKPITEVDLSGKSIYFNDVFYSCGNYGRDFIEKGNIENLATIPTEIVKTAYKYVKGAIVDKKYHSELIAWILSNNTFKIVATDTRSLAEAEYERPVVGKDFWVNMTELTMTGLVEFNPEKIIVGTRQVEHERLPIIIADKDGVEVKIFIAPKSKPLPSHYREIAPKGLFTFTITKHFIKHLKKNLKQFRIEDYHRCRIRLVSRSIEIYKYNANKTPSLAYRFSNSVSNNGEVTFDIDPMRLVKLLEEISHREMIGKVDDPNKPLAITSRNYLGLISTCLPPQK